MFKPRPFKFLGFLILILRIKISNPFPPPQILQSSHSHLAVDQISVTMSRSGQPPDLKKYMDKKLQIKLNANRMVVGTLRGFDQFMNLVVDNTVEVNGNEKTDIGMVVIRGNSVVTVEALEPVGTMQ
ncbi:probable small nuclear ribonucleoprotein G [Durio zibethinus]|uniref:Small nuclear ribonucleoprotein G n=1 Tax=Durio zibethinus TaxID=66656 RepID=A0A6P6AMJ9_DURZI|nr:probable small nuclear ribonucleoprotein G [Durio zibethinus]